LYLFGYIQDACGIVKYADIVEMQRRRAAKANGKNAKLLVRREPKAGSGNSIQESEIQIVEGPLPPWRRCGNLWVLIWARLQCVTVL
jgi:hypothetical protein